MPSRSADSRRVKKPSPDDRDAAIVRYDVLATTPEPAGKLPFLTVAIGASAGGLQAFSEFLANLPADTGMAFVLIQHLDPDHKSLLVDLLRAQTRMPVVEAADGMQVAPNTVFVIPPDATLTISGARLVLSKPAAARIDRCPVDSFFTSLAEDQASHAVCIVLAGTGSDGTRSLRAVMQQGGLILAQAQDNGQAMQGMPSSAMGTGLVDHLLAARDMPATLIDHQRTLSEPWLSPDDATAPRLDAREFSEICALVRNRTGHDFSHYKKPSLLRRIGRRMQAHHAASVQDLMKLLREQPRQIDRLFHELLLGVTAFFRDPDAFDVVQATVLPKILAAKGAADQVRIWVPGCASGEEVYSLAILFREAMEGQDTPPKAQFFGTDIDPEAIATARAARYRKAALAHMAPERRDRWFIEDGAFYRPVREIREMCVFSVHSLIKDPPFSKLDMISCRNLLIYFNSELQSRVIRNFHYALCAGGWLFLGPSESMARGTALFAEIDQHERVFQRQDAAAVLPGVPARGAAPTGLAPSTNGAPAGETLDDGLDRSARQALERYSPAYVVIDQASTIVRFSGGQVARFLEPSPGTANLSLFSMLRKGLRRVVRATVQEAIADHRTIVRDDLVLDIDGRAHVVTLIVQPISLNRAVATPDTSSPRGAATAEPAAPERYLVAFHDGGTARVRAAGLVGTTEIAADDDRAIARELAATRSLLLGSIADLETANEEMKSVNEEYQSANEELQATNEELETAKEEMQSTNEELQTINLELTTKNDMLTRLNNDFQNLLDATQIATVFLDPQLRITRFTPPIIELFRLRESDLGRPITDITSHLNYDNLPADVAAVLDQHQIIEREVQLNEGGTSFLMRIRPYRTGAKAVEGVVIAFIDISAQKRQQAGEAMQSLNQTLERRVAERTTELETSAHQLTHQISERRYAEEMLRQAQKLEAVGKLTGGIAHDFNNLLGVIIGNVELLLDVARENADQTDLAREILNSALRGAELTRRLLAFARKQPLQPQLIDLNILLPNHLATLHRTLGEAIHVTATMAPRLWLTHADPSQIGDALLNLALNARDAMPDGGNLVIETANVHLAGLSVIETSEASEGDYVVLTVTDTGTGMPPEVIERATEPFFTTKPPAVGSGLGLSMIYGFARQSGGLLRIDSEVDVGTTVKLFLPRALDQVAAVIAAPDEGAAEQGRNETILVVDDNLTLRDVAQRHLIRLGYRVSAAANGPAALAILRSGATFDLLFTDVVMPEGLSGYDLADAARGLQPGLKVLFTSGYASDLPTDGEVSHDRQPLLRKPYRQHALAAALRAALDGRPVLGSHATPR
jgi:two-component system CheB/CheR fusion protein